MSDKNRSELTWRKLFDADGVLLYEGFTRNGKPYGTGVSYFRNGSKYQEGVFDIKGLVRGREYYSNGNLRFEGNYHICYGYGPNYPCSGDFYSITGEKIFSGNATLRMGGVGYPSIEVPKDYGEVSQSDRPKIDYTMWEDVR